MGYETVLSFCIGILAVLFCGWLFSLKTKGILGLLFNTAVGAFLIVALSVFTPFAVALNPLNALIVGMLGLPGAALVLLVAFAI